MKREDFLKKLEEMLISQIKIKINHGINHDLSNFSNQQQTNDVFSEKWSKYSHSQEKELLYEFQKKWYLELYGFDSEESLRGFLKNCDVIFDAGCGLGYKAAWFAQLAPHALIIGMDFSDSVKQASLVYQDISNLFFIQGDIANTNFKDNSFSYVSCDQVIMHTEDPEVTFIELARICKKPRGQVACYFYAKKALPRELLDDYFRSACTNMTNEELWAMSQQLTELGKRLSELNISFEAPDIPQLGIKGGTYDIQRFIYWNFIKCFWNVELGKETSIVTNYDWYSPSNARRFSENEVREIVKRNNLVVDFFHIEDACYSGRFINSSSELSK
ncbi:class I SAM-dependent methyltransferase [Thiothrix sp.]|uniref:class I SAM-dependent methyltransferase n=1 Tax=Thiothrix sp. TaxID=1032 RepID=UPI00257F0748|nr:class I SAM-dependent methyltransferase [Thiothrix sp.]